MELSDRCNIYHLAGRLQRAVGAETPVPGGARLASLVRGRPPKVPDLRRARDEGGQTVRLRHRRVPLRALRTVLDRRGRVLRLFGRVQSAGRRQHRLRRQRC